MYFRLSFNHFDSTDCSRQPTKYLLFPCFNFLWHFTCRLHIHIFYIAFTCFFLCISFFFFVLPAFLWSLFYYTVFPSRSRQLYASLSLRADIVVMWKTCLKVIAFYPKPRRERERKNKQISPLHDEAALCCYCCCCCCWYYCWHQLI